MQEHAQDQLAEKGFHARQSATLDLVDFLMLAGTDNLSTEAREKLASMIITLANAHYTDEPIDVFITKIRRFLKVEVQS